MESVDEHETARRLLTAVGVVVAIVAWTAAALPFLAVAAFAMVDSSCDGPPELQTDSLWWPIGVLAIWLVPFVGVAARRRSSVSIAVAAVAVVVALTALTQIVLEPTPFCF